MDHAAASLPLTCHPATPDAVLTAVGAQITRADRGWCIRYHLDGDVARLRLPERGPAGPADELWRHSCCEAFVRARGARAYHELNFSPSGQWACYAFSGERQRDVGYQPVASPSIDCRRKADAFLLTAAVPDALMPPGEALEFGLAVVAESAAGTLAYWALAHPAARPDFHHPDAFAHCVALAPGGR